MSIHVFGRNEFGVACLRCGLFNHYERINDPCEGLWDERIIDKAEREIGQHQLTIRLIRQAQKHVPNADTISKEKGRMQP